MLLCVGDRVRTPDGEGYVEEVTRWRDRILEMSDAEAVEFSDQCRMTHGVDYKKTWGFVVVRVGARSRRYPLGKIAVVESRDDIR